MCSNPSKVVYKRQFDPNVPLHERKRPVPDTEDRALTAYLEGQLEELLSLSEVPPRCPHCQGDGTALSARAADPKPALPVFRCIRCDVHFRRTTGTPLSGLKLHQPWLAELLRLLSQQRSAAGAARRLGIKGVTVVRYVARFRAWLLDVDASGYWESKVRLGMEIRPEAACPRCQMAGTLHYRGFDSHSRERRCTCDHCGGYVLLGDIVNAQGADFELDHRVTKRPSSRRRKLA